MDRPHSQHGKPEQKGNMFRPKEHSAPAALHATESLATHSSAEFASTSNKILHSNLSSPLAGICLAYDRHRDMTSWTLSDLVTVLTCLRKVMAGAIQRKARTWL
jgi:hypothetical protein